MRSLVAKDTAPDAPPAPPLRGRSSAFADAAAPIIYFDLASCYGAADGVVSITLEATRLMMTSDGPIKDFITVGHLRMTMRALRQLRDAIDAIELLVAPEAQGTAN